MLPTFQFAQERHAAGIHAIYAPYCETTAVSFELAPPSVGEMAERIRRTTARYPWLVCEYDSRVAGYVYASSHRERQAYQWSVDVSAYVAPTCRRAGVARGLYTSLFKILALQGFYKAHAGIALPNPSSVGVHEAMGFEPVGVYRAVGYKLGTWHDVGWWQFDLQPRGTQPAVPTAITEIMDMLLVREALDMGLSLVRVQALTASA